MPDDTRLFRVYKLKSRLSLQDPDMPSPRFHTVIFVETEARGPESGTKHHVTGDIVSGMHYESKAYPEPGELEILHSKEFFGYVETSKYPESFDSVLREIPAPPKQKAFNIKTMRTEPVKTWKPLTFYAPGEPREPLIKCTEWTEQRAIPALISGGHIFVDEST